MAHPPAAGRVDVGRDGVAAGVALRRRLSTGILARLRGRAHGQGGGRPSHTQHEAAAEQAASPARASSRGIGHPGLKQQQPAPTLMTAFLAASAALHSRVQEECTPSRPARPACSPRPGGRGGGRGGGWACRAGASTVRGAALAGAPTLPLWKCRCKGGLASDVQKAGVWRSRRRGKKHVKPRLAAGLGPGRGMPAPQGPTPARCRQACSQARVVARAAGLRAHRLGGGGLPLACLLVVSLQ